MSQQCTADTVWEDASYELLATRPIKDYEHGARITECVQPEAEELIGNMQHASGFALTLTTQWIIQ